MRSRWRTVLDRPGRYRLLALLESAAYTWIHRRPVWITRNGPYWTIRTWRGATTVSAGYRWRGPDFWRDLTADLLFFQYRPRAGDVVVDIGAGMGEELPSLCQSVAPGGRVIAVEAHPFTYEGLVRAISLNRLANCVPVAAALSDQTGTTMISDVDDPDLNSTLPGALLTRAAGPGAGRHARRPGPAHVDRADRPAHDEHRRCGASGHPRHGPCVAPDAKRRDLVPRLPRGRVRRRIPAGRKT